MTEHICALCMETFEPTDLDYCYMSEDNADRHAAMADPTTPADVTALVELLRRVVLPRCSADASHRAEDTIMRAVLRAIAAGTATDPAGMASAALTTRDIEFARWYR